jgi:hypothetical protein
MGDRHHEQNNSPDRPAACRSLRSWMLLGVVCSVALDRKVESAGDRAFAGRTRRERDGVAAGRRLSWLATAPARRTEFCPACAGSVSVPTASPRAQRGLALFFLDGATHALASPRPGTFSTKDRVTLADSLRSKENRVPTGTFRLRRRSVSGPLSCASRRVSGRPE